MTSRNRTGLKALALVTASVVGIVAAAQVAEAVTRGPQVTPAGAVCWEDSSCAARFVVDAPRAARDVRYTVRREGRRLVVRVAWCTPGGLCD